MLGTDAFQETDVTGITLPITKHNYARDRRAQDIARTMREAFDIARTAGPGPVLVDITKDAQQAADRVRLAARPVELPGCTSTVPHDALGRPGRAPPS